MNAVGACSHCLLPVGRIGLQREVNGETRRFCCYGCCLAYQVHHGEGDEPEAAALLIRLGVGAFLAMVIMLFSLLLYSGTFDETDGWLVNRIHWLLWALATPLIVILGSPFIAGGWQAARRLRVSTDTLVSIGALAAYGYSGYQVVRGSGIVYFDTATMVLILFTLGRYLEAQGRVRAMRSLAPMLAAERASVRVVADGIDAIEPVHSVQPGTIVHIFPGERIAVDGVVIDGHSDCDEAIMTGQSETQLKAPGARVHAGSINGHGQIWVRATVAGSDTRWIQISRLVRDALARKSLLGSTIDNAAAIFIPFVLLLAAGTVWFWSSRGPFEVALLIGLAVLVVACPCSLGLAAPLATALGIGQAARRGILIRSGGVLEQLARIRGIAFDKTGTLTRGKPQPVYVVVEGTTENDLLRCATALASGSEHCIARAITEQGGVDGIDFRPAIEIRAHPGAGVTGQIDGVLCAMGSRVFMTALGWTIPEKRLGMADASGYTLVYIGWAGRVHGMLALSDTTLPEAKRVIKALHEHGVQTLLLSGDTQGPVANVADALGISTWQAELTPEGKVRALREWAVKRGGPIAMVGDGLNDGPVLASASVGIAVGAATDLAKESADITLPTGGLGTLPWLIQLANRVRKSILANLAWALGYNAVALMLAVTGLLQPVVAAGLMFGSSVLVVVRSLRASRESASIETGPDVPAEASVTHVYST
jgi:P-type Cu2+ transporter